MMPQRYEVKHRGTAIVCGSAPCVFEDLENAKKLRPNATILGVNGTAGMFEEIEHIWTQHNNFASEFRSIAKRPIKIHARPKIMGNDVDYWWPELSSVKGSSGLAGSLWAKAMGFDEVIMVGIPLSTSETKYCDKYPANRNLKDFATEGNILTWQQFVRLYKEEGKTNGIYSMSGYTRKIFGAPC